jgi:hypothetical protein
LCNCHVHSEILLFCVLIRDFTMQCES